LGDFVEEKLLWVAKRRSMGWSQQMWHVPQQTRRMLATLLFRNVGATLLFRNRRLVVSDKKYLASFGDKKFDSPCLNHLVSIIYILLNLKWKGVEMKIIWRQIV